MEQRAENRDQAPDFSLLAAGSGRRVTLWGNDGRPVVLIFHLQGTAPTAREINRAVRQRYPDPDEVLVASVIDLCIVPPLYWVTVSLILGQAYEQPPLNCRRTPTPLTTQSYSPTGAEG